MISRPLGRVKVLIGLAFLLLILIKVTTIQVSQFDVVPGVRSLLTYSYEDEIYGVSCKSDLQRGASPSTFINKNLNLIPKRSLAAWLISPGYSWVVSQACTGGRNAQRVLVTYAQWLIIAATFFSVLSGRFLTSSWMVSITIGLLVIYHSSLEQILRDPGADGYLMLIASTWLAASSHFMKTGSLPSLTVVVLAVMFGTVFDLAFAGVALGLPALLVVGYPFRKIFADRIVKRLQQRKRMRQKSLAAKAAMIGGRQTAVLPNRITGTFRWMIGQGVPETPDVHWGRNISRGGLFRAINAPFGLWVFRKNRWRHLVLGWASTVALAVVVAAGAYGALSHALTGAVRNPLPDLVGTGINAEWIYLWIVAIVEPLDVYGYLSLWVLVSCAFQSPMDGIFSFLESSWLIIMTLLSLLIFAFVFDMVDYRLMEHLKKVTPEHGIDLRLPVRQVFVWFQPALITVGVAGAYNLVKVANSRFGDS